MIYICTYLHKEHTMCMTMTNYMQMRPTFRFAFLNKEIARGRRLLVGNVKDSVQYNTQQQEENNIVMIIINFMMSCYIVYYKLRDRKKEKAFYTIFQLFQDLFHNIVIIFLYISHFVCICVCFCLNNLTFRNFRD